LLEPHIPAVDLEDFRQRDQGSGRKVYRNDLPVGDDSIAYEDYSAPAVWGLPYSVLRVKVEPRPHEQFMYHSGEEILFPVTGAIKYLFIHADGGRPSRFDVTVDENEIAKINCQIPHHA